MARETRLLPDARIEVRTLRWVRRGFIVLTILGWVVLIGVSLWVASHITRALLLLIIAALLAYALAPLVKILERVMPRFLAILCVYLLVLGVVSIFCYFTIRTTIEQTRQLTRTVQQLLQPGANGEPSQLEQTLSGYGITHEQIVNTQHQLVTWAETFAANSFSLLRSIFDFIIDIIIVAVLSIYLLIDGSRVASWTRRNMPNAARASFFLDTLQRIVGGYIRGQVTLAVLIGILVWLGMLILHVPYAVFLGFLAFVMAFIPVLGTFVSGAVCVLVGLTQGVLIAVFVLLYFVVIHVIEGELVGPRIVGKAIGLHPVVSLFALVAGAELFGVVGALFASPFAGVLQAIAIALWTEWRRSHPEQFQQEETQLTEEVEEVTTETARHPVAGSPVERNDEKGEK